MLFDFIVWFYAEFYFIAMYCMTFHCIVSHGMVLYLISINNNTICFTCLVMLLDYWACWHSIQAVPDIHWAKKRHFGPKRSLLRSLAAQKRPNISPKCVVTMIPTQTEQPVTVVTKYGPRRPPRASRATKRGTLGQISPFY